VYTGNAVEDIEPDSTILKVISYDLTPNAFEGTIAPGITTNNISLTDRDGKPIKSTTTTTNHIVATWEGSSNMRSPPLIRKGEPVEIYKIGNQDKWWWRATGRGRDFRTTDRVIFEVGATDPNKPGAEKNDSNTYSAYLDSHNQKVGFKTSKANGEAVGFALEADLAAGTFYITDDSTSPGNRIFLDSGAKSGSPKFQVNISSGTTLLFDNDHCIIKVPKAFVVQSGERIVFDSPLTVFNLNKVGTIIINTSGFVVNATKDIILKASGVIGLNGVATKIMGVLAAGSVRLSGLFKGPVGSEYTPSAVSDPLEGSVSESNNSPDTTTSTPVTSLPVA
jgi:hypothetical protein